MRGRKEAISQTACRISLTPTPSAGTIHLPPTHCANSRTDHLPATRTSNRRGREMKVRKQSSRDKTTSVLLGFEAELWATANALCGSMDAAEYKHVVLGLIFLKYISDAKVVFVPQRSSHHPQAHLRRLRGAPRQAGRPNATRAPIPRTPTSLPAPSEAPACAGTADRRQAGAEQKASSGPTHGQRQLRLGPAHNPQPRAHGAGGLRPCQRLHVLHSVGRGRDPLCRHAGARGGRRTPLRPRWLGWWRSLRNSKPKLPSSMPRLPEICKSSDSGRTRDDT